MFTIVYETHMFGQDSRGMNDPGCPEWLIFHSC